MGTPRRDFPKLASLAASSLLGGALALSGCAAEPPMPPPQQAPLAQPPSLVAALQTTKQPTRASGQLDYGDAVPLKPCAFDPSVLSLPAGGALLLRVTAPVPTELGLALETARGPKKVHAPRDFAEEDRAARKGDAWFYENEALARQAPAGTVAERELAIWPGDLHGDARFDLALWDTSYAPGAGGDDLRSRPMHLSFSGRCAGFTLTLEKSETQIHIGEAKRLHGQLLPSGDGVGRMRVELSLVGVPAGVSTSVRSDDPGAGNWTAPRDITFELAPGPASRPGDYPIALQARLGGVTRSETLTLHLLPKDDY